MSALRFGIVGARRVRQGLGPFVAKHLVAQGHSVAAVLGRTEASAAAGAEDVRRASGARPAPYAERSAFLAAGLDAVMVATPAGTHLAEVRAALGAGLHVLCEKPLAWHPETDWEGQIAALEDLAHGAGVVLAANAQWPWAIPAWCELFGTERAALAAAPVRRFAMGLAPASIGRQMVGDALPHPLSVAQALRPDVDALADVRVRGAEGLVTVDFTLTGERGPLAVTVELEGGAAAQPRSAWLEIDGRRAERCVRTRDYALFLRDGARVVDLPDPLFARLAEFAGRIVAPPAATVDRALSRRAAFLAEIDRGWVSAGFGSR